MLARMELVLILTLLFGVGALVASVASRRGAERSAFRAAPPPARAAAKRGPVQATEAKGLGVEAAAPDSVALAPSSPLAAIPDQAPSERRKHPRIQSDQTFTITPFAGRAMMAQCSDVSEGGMRFGIVGSTLRAGDLVRVTFNIGAETVEAIGSVLRVQALDPITSDVSLEFVRVDPWAAELLTQALEADA
jgi:hypothetical protein